MNQKYNRRKIIRSRNMRKRKISANTLIELIVFRLAYFFFILFFCIIILVISTNNGFQTILIL